MTEFVSRFNGAAQLYPPIEPYERRMLPVGGRHSVYVESCGSPKGIPVLFLHGGPGGGCNPTMRRYFNPEIYRVILFDQRGCGRSSPAGNVDENTSWHLVSDMELIRRTLGIERWILFGGSWGATLALVYAQTHPDRVIQLVLRGVFLMTRLELDWFYGGSAGRFRPDQWNSFVEPIPEDERDDLIEAYSRRLFSGDPDKEVFHARRWLAWENSMLTLEPVATARPASHAYAHTFARIENHYFRNLGFLERDNYILENTSKLRGIPGKIVQGRYDLVCPPVAAWSLARHWPDASLEIVQAGHSLSEPEITRALIRTMNEIGRGRQTTARKQPDLRRQSL